MTFEILAAIFLACIGGAWMLFPFLMLSKANQIIKGQKETNRLIERMNPRHDELERGFISKPPPLPDGWPYAYSENGVKQTSMADEKV